MNTYFRHLTNRYGAEKASTYRPAALAGACSFGILLDFYSDKPLYPLVSL